MELSCQLEHLGARLAMEWCPRELNEEADRLSNWNCEGFEEANRISLDLNKMNWFMLDRLMELGIEFANEKEVNAHPVGRARKKRKLRETEPW